MKAALVAIIALSPLLQAGDPGSRVLYMGGTASGVPAKSTARIAVNEEEALTLRCKNHSFTIPYRNINTLEYGLRVSRRYIEAVVISPAFLFAKKKTHYLTIGYSDADGNQQAVVLEVNKDDIRPLLVSLEARTGRRVEFQDEEARKAGKG